MRLYIAEKPSVGRELAKILPGPVSRHDGYLVTKGGVVTWLFGHILRQAEPAEYAERYKFWRAEDLPIIPAHWKLYVAKGCEKQFGIVKALIEKADEIVHGGDPDREGQLLVDEVLDYLGNQKPVRRILLNALDEKSMRKANADLRDNRDFFNLKQSALARARADWLIGMNLSRAYTLAARRAGHKKVVLPVGRVKTPTLALVVRREREIEHFQPVDYYTIKGVFAHENGDFTAQWKPKDTQPGLDSENRLVDKAAAEQALKAFREEPREGRIQSYQKTKKQEPQPLPFSLSTLQVLAGKRYGYAPQLVLDTAQKLYEKKLTTYPRSDCEYLPKNQLADAEIIFKNLGQCGDQSIMSWTQNADTSIRSRAWNDKKISAHHAIIPTTVPAKMERLTQEEQNLYHLIARGYLAQFYPVHTYDQTKIAVLYHGEHFAASGRTEREAGWKVMYSKEKKKADEDEGGLLPQMKKGDAVHFSRGSMKTSATKPPVRFTPSTLLAGMKEIHKYVKNPEAKKQLKDVYGIGTEATRATIIDDLIRRKFLKATGKKKYLVPTEQAYLLIDALPDEMTYPDETAIWEDKLHSMSEGDGTLEDFLAGQIAFTKKLCAKAGAAFGLAGRIAPRQVLSSASYEPAASRRPISRASRHPAAGRQTVSSASYTPRRPARPSTTAAPRQSSAPTAEDWAELGDLFGPPAYTSRPRADKPKYSAKPMEQMKRQTKGGAKQADEDKYLCPHCREGHLRRIHGKNGVFWGCTNYPHCTATFDDAHGAPVL